MAVNKTKSGVWYYKVRWIDNNGITHQKKKENKIWKRSDAQKEERAFILSLEGNKSNCEMTYEELYNLYKEAKAEEIKVRSFTTYDERQTSFVLPKFKDKRLSDIDRNSASQWQIWLIKQRKKNGEPYSNDYIKSVQSTFKQVLNWAVEEGYLISSPIKKKILIRKDEKRAEMDFWTPDEFNMFYSVIDDLQDKVTFRLLFWGGIRKGEMIGLNIEDYDSIDKVISINKQWDTQNKKMTTPKNKLGYRKISLDNETSRLVEELISRYKRCYGFGLNFPLIGLAKRLPPQTLLNRKNRYVKKSGVKYIRIHDFRHSHVSYLINQGFQPTDIAARLGHNVSETLDRYGHLYPDRQKLMASNIDKSHIL